MDLSFVASTLATPIGMLIGMFIVNHMQRRGLRQERERIEEERERLNQRAQQLIELTEELRQRCLENGFTIVHREDSVHLRRLPRSTERDTAPPATQNDPEAPQAYRTRQIRLKSPPPDEITDQTSNPST